MATGKKRVVSARALLSQRNALVALAQALTQEQTGGAMSTTLDALRRLLGFSGALAYRCEGSLLRLVCDHKLPQRCKAWLASLSLDDEHPWFVAQRTALHVRSEVDADLAAERAGVSIAPMLREAGWSAVAAAPIALGRRVLGVVVVAGDSAESLGGEQLRTVEAACSLLALALVRETHAECEASRPEQTATAQLATVGLVAASVVEDLDSPIHSLQLLLETQDALVQSLRKAVGGQPVELQELADVTLELTATAQRISDITYRLSSVNDDAGTITVDLGKLTRSAAAMVHHHIAKIGLELELHGDDLAIGVEGRDADLRMLLVQLLLYAAKRCAMSGVDAPRMIVTVSTQASNATVAIATNDKPVSSTRSGIAMFDAWMDRASSEHGNEPGLALAKHTVLAHGGHIEVGQSDLGGSELRVWLPTSPESIRPEEQRPSFPMPTLRPAKGVIPVVLWIDDDDVAAASVRRFFTTYDIRVTASIAEAERELDQLVEPPELVFCSVELPDGFGTELHRQLPAETAARFVFMSSGVIPTDVADYLRTSSCETLIRPITFDEVASILEGEANDDSLSAATTLRPPPPDGPPPPGGPPPLGGGQTHSSNPPAG